MREPRRAEHRPRPASSRALRGPHAEVAPVAEIQAQLFVDLDTHLRRLRPRLPPLHPGNDLARGPTDAGRGDRRPARDPSLPRQHRRACSPRCKPGSRRSRDSSPVIDAAAVAGVPVLNASPVLNAQLEPTAEALLAFQRQTPACLQRPRPADRHQRRPRSRRSGSSARPRRSATTRPWLFRQRRQRAQQGNGHRQLASAPSCSSPRSGRTTRAAPSSRVRANGGPNADNILHYNPYPNTASPGQDRRVRGRQRALRRRARR